MKRCKWKNLENHQIYMDYHDKEWGIPSYEDGYLFEMIVLESFQAGLSWLTILNKREAFRLAFDNFDPHLIKDYDESKIKKLLADKSIIRNENKIRATINNALCFIKIQEEFASFSEYIWSFTNHEIVFNPDPNISKNELSERVSRDLKKRGFKYMGSVISYSYLEAVGIMNNHIPQCFKYSKNKIEEVEKSL